ncbi:MAG: polysaccharide export protein [Hyphomicrobiaceae bacterium]|nr:polysaccharide export protein [Hyphomicrobiaceae bacterium]
MALSIGCGLLTGCGVSSLNDVSPGAQSLGSTREATGSVSKPAKNTGAATDPTVKATAASMVAVAQPGSASYKIGPFDVLDVSVFKVPELSKTVQVSDAGTVNLPLVGEVMAGGRTARDVEHELTKTLGDKYLQKPQVTVFVKEYNSQRVTLDGAVKKPGVFPIQGNLTLLQALAIAQGLDPAADSTVVIFRDQDGQRAVARFDVSEIRSGAVADPQLQAGDVVVAGSSALKEAWNNFLRALPIASAFALL